MRLISVCVVTLVVSTFASVTAAPQGTSAVLKAGEQLNAMPPAAPKTPALDEADILAIQLIQMAALRANDACASLETTKTAKSLQEQAVARFAKKYPEFEVDFSKGVLVAKAASK